MNLFPLTSLPRTGSTLLLNILNQNPKFQIGPDSEVGNLLLQNKDFMCDNIHHFQLPNETATECFKNFCVDGTKSWIKTICSDDKIFVDKSRHWLENLNYFFTLFPDIKILINIRDLRGIINSFEKIHENSLYVNNLDFRENLSFDQQNYRIGTILNLPYVKNGLFSLKELIDIPKKYINNIKICRYEDLISNPEKQLREIYEFLNIDNFNHDFNNIQQSYNNDNPYQPYGCHKIENRLKPFKQEDFVYLRQDVQNTIIKEHIWYYKNFYPEVLSQVV